MKNRKNYAALARRWWWLVVLAALVGAAGAYGGSKQITPTYEATATLLVNETAAPNSLTYSDVLLSQQLTKTYSKIAVQRPVLNQVIQQAKLPFTEEQLQKMVSANAETNTQLIGLSVRSNNAQQAAQIANLVAQAFIAQQRERLASGEASNAISVVEPATAPRDPVSPKTSINTLLGGFVAALVIGGVLLGLALLDDTVKSLQDVEEALHLPVLGFVKRNAADAKLAVDAGHVHQTHHSAETFRVIRTNLGFTTASNHARTLLVTSTQKGEGKSTTASKLAIALAEAGHRVILVDADLRLPSVHRIFGLQNGQGLTNALVGQATGAGKLLQPTALPTLHVLTSGPLPPNPTELLQSERMALFLRSLSEGADYVLLDSPPVLAVADSLALAAQAQGVVLVVESGHVKIGRVSETTAALQRAGTPIVGAILNKVTRDAKESAYRYEYGGYYGPVDAKQHPLLEQVAGPGEGPVVLRPAASRDGLSA